MKKITKKRIMAVLSAATVLLTSGVGTGISLNAAKADNATSATVIVDEPFTDLNILTRTKGSYTADMVYTMIYDTLFTLDANGNFAPNLVETWEIIAEGGYSSWSPLELPSGEFAPGWEVPPEFVDLAIYDTNVTGIMICQILEGVTFQNETPLTVDSLIALVNYAKAQPTNTLIYQTWAPVTITYIDDYTFVLGVNMVNYNIGFIDVMFNLASPQGSIVDVGELGNGAAGYPLGTGAYTLEEIVTESTGDTTECYAVELERWAGWRNVTEVPTQYVTFEYVENSNDAEMGVRSGDAAAAVVRDTIYNNQELFYYWRRNDEWEEKRKYYALEGNPLALYFNLDSEESIFGITEYRQAVAAGMDKVIFRESGGLDFDSNGFWCYLQNSHSTTDIPVNNMNYAQSLIESAGVIIGGIQIDVVVYDDSYFANETAYQYYCSVRDTLRDYLEELFSYVVNVNMIEASESQMATYESNGNYDIMLKEIDLHNINSAHKTLYGKGSDDIDYWLDIAARALDINTYMLLHLQAQYYNYAEESYVTNLGWQKRALLLQDNVSGVEPYEGFCPTGSSSRLDFRFIEVTTN
ncbi:MAG: hypothetical protein J6A63_05210 [Clostridia bacterium]|nr:hypothetical protein [Clostridia bacterium]